MEEEGGMLIGDGGVVGVPESILRREHDRTDRLMKKREANVDGQANQAYLQLFMQQFREKQKHIQAELELAGTVEQKKRADIFHSVASDLNLLHRHLASASGLLTPYDLRRLKDAVADLERASTLAQQQLIPKKKFGFKKKLETKAIDAQESFNKKNIDLVNSLEIETSLDTMCIVGPGFHDRHNEKLVLSKEDVCGHEVTLSNLHGCTVIIHGCPSSVFVRSISNTILLLGPVSTSVLLYGATDSTVSAFCHQMRIHDSVSSDFYIHVATDPIIENCRSVRFAPYTYSYPTFDKDVETSSLDPSVNKWDNVQDFDWLVVSHPSPYWSFLPPELEEPLSNRIVSTDTLNDRPRQPNK